MSRWTSNAKMRRLFLCVQERAQLSSSTLSLLHALAAFPSIQVLPPLLKNPSYAPG